MTQLENYPIFGLKMKDSLKVSDGIRECFERRSWAKGRVAELYRSAYELLKREGGRQHIVPREETTFPIIGIVREREGVLYRVYMLSSNEGSLPPKYPQESDLARSIKLECAEKPQTEVFLASWQGLAELKVINQRGVIVGAVTSEILGRRLNDQDITLDHSRGLKLVEDVLLEVFEL